jgi:hypothetical protein
MMKAKIFAVVTPASVLPSDWGVTPCSESYLAASSALESFPDALASVAEVADVPLPDWRLKAATKS